MKLLLTLVFLTYSTYGFAQAAATIKVFSNDNYKINYPNSWQLDTSKLAGTEFFIFSPLESDTDKFSENVNLIIQNLTGQVITLKQYKEITDKQLIDFATDLEVYSSSIIETEKDDYYKVVYAMTQGKKRLIITSLCFIKNDKAFLITFTTEQIKYEQYKTTGEEILSSFSWIN